MSRTRRKQAIRDSRSASRTLRYFVRAAGFNRNAEDLSRTIHDHFQIGDRIEVQMKRYTESSAKRRADQPARVVAPTSVNFGSSNFIERAEGPCPMMMSS